MPRVLNRNTDTIPPGAVYVGRGTPWGNPYGFYKSPGVLYPVYTRKDACEAYRPYIEARIAKGEVDLAPLRGKDLVCSCTPLDCHADILLELANG